MDEVGWTIHRKRAWTSLMSGCHYDVIDFTINKYVEAGNAGAQRHIRRWMQHLSDFIHSLDLVHARPRPGRLKAQPAHTLDCVLAVEVEGSTSEGPVIEDFAIYLADERELDEPGSGEVIRGGEIALDLPDGAFEVACYLPSSGAYSVWWPLSGGTDTRLKLPDFSHDLVVRIKRAS
jgi:hypothetical protein